MTIIAHGPVERMGAKQFNVLVDPGDYLGQFQAAGCETNEAWAGSSPLKVTISRKQWVSLLQPGDLVEYELETVQRKDKNSPSGYKIGTRGVAMRII